jgi:predicted permease
MTSSLEDLRRAVRTLRRTPAFALAAIGMLALGLGASTAMFSVINAVWLEPLPYASPDRLVAIEEAVPRLAAISPRLPVNAYDFLQWRQRSSAFDAFSLLETGGTRMTVAGGRPLAVVNGSVSANFFAMLGITPAAGRLFSEGDDAHGAGHVAVLSDGLWARVFDRDPAAVGRQIRVGNQTVEVIGILPASVRVPRQGQIETLAFGDVDADLWTPLVVDDGAIVKMSEFDFGCIARMKPGVTVASARADLEVIEAGIAQSAGADQELHAIVTPLATQGASRSREAVVLLSAAVGVVLLIVCVNLSNALLSRATGRRRELAIQAALGASRWTLMRQSLAESLVVAAAGATGGLAIAEWAIRAILLTSPLGLPQWRSTAIDGRVVLFTGAIALVVAVLLAVLPAWKMATADPHDALRSVDRGTTEGGKSQTIRRGFIGVEVALSTACLVVAGLLIGSFWRLLDVDTGFRADHAFAVPLTLVGSFPSDAAAVALARDVMAQAAAVPGVTAVGLVNRLPLTGEGSNNALIPDTPVTGAPPVADYRTISENYFAAIGVPIISGRTFRASDGDHLVGLVSEGTAARLWPGMNPIGHHFRLGGADAPPIEIIGVTGDVHGVSLQKLPNLTVYVPFWQRLRSGLAVVVRTAGDPAAEMRSTSEIVRAALPDQPTPRARLLDDLVDATLVGRRFQLNVVMAFAAVALLLAAMGVYTIVAQSMARRTREVGIRLALGANRADVWRLVGREGFVPVAVGLAAGLGLALEASGFVRSVLFGLRPFDPATYAGVALVMIVAAAGACAWPAYRSGRIDPLTALRQL